MSVDWKRLSQLAVEEMGCSSAAELDKLASELICLDYECHKCGYVCKTETALSNHQLSRQCDLNAERRKAKEIGDGTYLPPCLRKQRCEVCKRDFANVSALTRHLKTKKHAMCVAAERRPLPTTCTLCGRNIGSDRKKWCRHLKESKKCHGKVDGSNLPKWQELYRLFQCKFQVPARFRKYEA